MPRLDARALLFDMDGTLVDSHAVVTRIWTRFAERFDIDVRDILSTSHGVRMADTMRRHAPDADIEALVAEFSEIELADRDGVVEVPGARALLGALPAESFAVVTSATCQLAALRMELCGMPFPPASVTAEDVERGKPDPQGYLLAAERLGAEPADSVVFEDAEAGILAGLAAGMRVVVIGEHESGSTDGLLRLRDYSTVTATNEGDRVFLEGNFT